jgi:predicted enzyme related to lactoylglutathione lyase
VVFDCPDPVALATFYAELLGGQVVDDDDPTWTEVHVEGSSVKLAFEPVENYLRPQWPDGQPQQIHLDLTVTDLASASRQAVELGATVVGDGVVEKDCTFLVHLDPAGHPFCFLQDHRPPA